MKRSTLTIVVRRFFYFGISGLLVCFCIYEHLFQQQAYCNELAKEAWGVIEIPSWNDTICSPSDVINICSKCLRSSDRLNITTVKELYISRAQAYAKLHMVKNALKDIDAAMQINNGSISAQSWMAYLKILNGNNIGYSELEKIVGTKPSIYLPYHHLASVQLISGNFNISIEMATESLSKYEQPDAYFVRARAYIGVGNCEKALNDLDLCVVNWPSFQTGHIQYLRGTILLSTGNYEKAISAFEVSRRCEYKPHQSLCQIWKINFLEEKYFLSLLTAKKLLEDDSHEAFSHIASAASSCAVGAYIEALCHAKNAIKIQPNNKEAYIELANAYKGNKQYRESIIAFEKALRLDADSAHALAGKAIILATCGNANFRDHEQALRLARRSCTLTKYREPYCLIAYAITLAGVGDFKQACIYVKDAIKLVPRGAQSKKASYESLLKLFEEKNKFPETFIR